MTNDEKISSAAVEVTNGDLFRHSSFVIRIFRRSATAFLDLLYTRRCEACEGFLESGREGTRQWLCDSCHAGMARIEAPFCHVCGEPYDGEMTVLFRCGNCADLKLHFEFAIAGYKAEGAVRKLVHRFKYQRALHLRGLLGAMLARSLEDSRLSDQNSHWTLVPVPLFHARQREREYNQALELCRVLSNATGMPLLDAMSRVRSTTPQASLSRHQRMENLRGAFTMKRGLVKKGVLQGSAVLLVDDVLTTGSTTSECARILRKEAGVEKVVVITVARG
jgi:competence protein ComFC